MILTSRPSYASSFNGLGSFPTQARLTSLLFSAFDGKLACVDRSWSSVDAHYVEEPNRLVYSYCNQPDSPSSQEVVHGKVRAHWAE